MTRYQWGVKRYRLQGRGRKVEKCTFVLYKPDSQLVSTTQALIREKELSNKNKDKAVTTMWSPTCNQQGLLAICGKLLILVIRDEVLVIGDLITICSILPDFRQ